MKNKIRVAVLYGGRSGEHEVSLRSAASVIKNLDKSRFEVVPIGIDKSGKWHAAPPEALMQNTASIPVFDNAPVVDLPAYPVANHQTQKNQSVSPANFDVVFPVVHGTLCEDGTLQGLLELAEVAYVGCGVLASAVGMDKEVAKRLVRDAGLKMVPYVSLTAGTWAKNSEAITARVEKELGYPCFVKPSNCGSSVGVHKVRDRGALRVAILDALRYDTKILVEKAIDAREIELAVLENSDYGADPLVSIAGEINPTHEFYSYESKYLDENGAELIIPAKLSDSQMKGVQSMAKLVFQALECEGMARVDLFLDRKTGEIYFNEVNTIPGFTSISMYPKMWEASGLKYSDLLSKLVDLAIARHARKQKLSREFLPPV